jgi:ATP-dependent helicase/nuclease subunit B
MGHAFEAGRTSATAIERWATCPFQYLLQNVLGVEATRRPEDEWTITPRDRGLLVHQVLDAFFRELRAAGRLGPGDAFGPGDHARIQAIAEAHFAALEASGQTGHPLAWENARAEILADLHTLLEKDEEWRRADGLSPTYFERTFGRTDVADPWPAATLRLVDGRRVSFGGSLDRVDLSAAEERPRRALIVDYKTGRAIGFKGLGDDDPLLAGRHIQLALYARALRAGLGVGTDELEVRAEFRFVTSRGDFSRLTIRADERVDAELERVVRMVADGVGSGVFLAVPGEMNNGQFENCRLCDYDRVCSSSRDEVWERKHREPGALIHLELVGRPEGGS